jgi:hypothetical protein
MLDRSKPFTTFDGPNPMGAKYQQGARIFNSKDEELNWDGEIIEKDKRTTTLKMKPSGENK